MTYFTIVVGAVLSILLFIVSYMGIRFGTAAATVLGLLSMIPLTLIAVVPFFTGDVTGSNIWPANLPDGTAFFSGTAFYLFLQFSALYTWNAIAMEAAACYIGECKNPDRDAPIAMNLSGGYGTFIYTFLPDGGPRRAGSHVHPGEPRPERHPRRDGGAVDGCRREQDRHVGAGHRPPALRA